MPAKRLLLIALVAGLFLLSARAFQPFRSAAITSPGSSSGPQGAVQPMPRKMLGELVGQEFRLVVHSSPLGPRYTVISPDGVILGEDLSDEDVAREFPGLRIETMTADAPDHHLFE